MDMYAESLRAFLGPIVPYMDEPSVTEIMINGPNDIWIEQGGLLSRINASFTEDGLLAAARNMAQYVGRPLSEEHPRLDARLPDGSRIHVILPPMARCGTVIAIRKFFPGGLSVEDLIRFGSLTAEAAHLLQALVVSKKNVMVAGGTGSGKTTLLNTLSAYIPNEERILTIEDSAELQLTQQHLVPMESRPADRHGRGAVTIRDLLHSALRLRPDRIVIGEVRGGEIQVKVYERDGKDRATRRLERMVLTPFPIRVETALTNNDMTKVEVIDYRDDGATVYWRVMYSDNDSTETDVGSVDFRRFDDSSTVITFHSAHRLNAAGFHIPNKLVKIALKSTFLGFIEHYRTLVEGR